MLLDPLQRLLRLAAQQSTHFLQFHPIFMLVSLLDSHAVADAVDLSLDFIESLVEVDEHIVLPAFLLAALAVISLITVIPYESCWWLWAWPCLPSLLFNIIIATHPSP